MYKLLYSLLIIVFTLSLFACDEAPQPDLRQAVVEAFAQDTIALKVMSYDFLSLLEARRFDELDRQLIELQKNYEQGANEWAVLESFLIFNTNKEHYLTYFDEWVDHSDGRWTSRLARGSHHVALAWKKRGAKFINKTSQEQIDNMSHHFSLAKQDINAALAKTPRAIVGYKMLHQIANGMGEDEDKLKITKTALKVAPHSYYLRWQHISGLQPKWGGSIQQIRKFARDAQKSRQQNPRLYALLGYEHAVKGDQVERKKQFEKAIEHYTTALKYAPVGGWLRDRAYCYKKLNRFDEQTRDLNALLEISPDDADLLGRRGYAYVRKGHYPSAIADFERALELDAQLGYVSNNLGWIYYTQGDNKKAAGYFDKTLVHDPNNIYALTYCGITNARLALLDKAESCLLHALEVEPENADVWRNYGEVLHMQDNPKHLDALASYLKYADRKKEREMFNKIKKYLAEQNYPLLLPGSSTTRKSGEK